MTFGLNAERKEENKVLVSVAKLLCRIFPVETISLGHSRYASPSLQSLPSKDEYNIMKYHRDISSVLSGEENCRSSL